MPPSTTDPIFSPSDRPGSSLPPELQGKTPEEVAAYFQRREQILVNQIRQAPAPEPPPPRREEPADEKIDVFGDATGSITRLVDRKVAERVNAVTTAASPAVINSCRMSVRESHADYARFAGEIDKRMASMTPESQMNPQYWEMTYQLVKGSMTEQLVAEAREDERKKQNPVERVSPQGTPPEKPRELSDEEKTIARKLGMSQDKYRGAAERYEAEEGRLPLTLDSKEPRKKK
jgi:hypothetical protein